MTTPQSALEPSPQPSSAPKTAPVESRPGGPGYLLRGLYFILIGWWLGLIWTLLAWIFNITIIGLPLGILMINAIPQIMTLRPSRVQTRVDVVNGQTVVRQFPATQHPFLLRALYFVLIGWWFSFIWMLMAWIIIPLTLGLGIPLSCWMFDRTPDVTTLARS